MKTFTRGLLAISLVLSYAQAAAAQSADEVIERHLAALGGRAALEKLTTRVGTGTITLTTPVGDLSGPIEVTSARPNKERTLLSLDLSALGAGTMTADRRFDGVSGYEINSLQGNRDITGPELEGMKGQASAFPTPFLGYKQAGISVTLGSIEKVGNRDAYVLIGQPKSGSPVRLYIDAETFLPLKSVSMAEAPEVGQFEQTIEFSDYRDVGGVKVAFRLKATSPVQGFDVQMKKVEDNVAVDPSMFAKPAN